MRGTMQIALLVLAVLIALGTAVSWYLAAADRLAWWQLAGMGLTVLFLALIWLWPGEDEPKRPPA